MRPTVWAVRFQPHADRDWPSFRLVVQRGANSTGSPSPDNEPDSNNSERNHVAPRAACHPWLPFIQTSPLIPRFHPSPSMLRYTIALGRLS